MGEKIDIKSLREGLKWSQAQLAEYLGLDRSAISRMENGQEPKGPTERLLRQLAKDLPASPPAAAEAQA